MASYGKGADLEGTSLEWLQDVRTLEDQGIRRTGAILAVSANEMLGRLEGSYKRLIDSTGTDYRYTTQQQVARVNAIAEKAGDFINPATRRQIVELQQQDLVKAQRMGSQAGVDLAKIIDDSSKTLRQNAKPNMPAIDAAGKRLADFWSKENTSFRDRVRALTQVGAAQGLSYRKLANQVRELLVLEQKSGTESKRSERINKKLGIQTRAELIARTEIQTAYVQGQINQARKNGFEWGRWSAGAERTCGFCISRHGMVYEIDDIEGQIPAHPRCRCTVIPVEAPDGWKKGQQIDPKTAELDDEFWTKARADQIKEWKRDQNTNRRGEPKPKESLKSNSELDQAIRRYLNTPTNTQQYLMPGSDAPLPLWKPSGNTIPDVAAAAQIQADAIAAGNAAAKPNAPKPQVDVDIIPEEITAAGLDGVWKDMANNPTARKQLLDGITKKNAAATAKKQADAAKAKQQKDADATKKKDAEIKAAKAKKDAIDGLQKLGVSAAGAEQVWKLTQMYRGQGMSPEAATTKAIQDMASGKSKGKGKPSELDKTASQRNSRKQVIQEKGHGKVNQAHLDDLWVTMSNQQGQAGQNWNQLQKFAERHNISTLWGTGGKSKNMLTLAKDSRALSSSLQSAAARRDTDGIWQRAALDQIKAHQAKDGIMHFTPTLDRLVQIKGTAGVNGSTAPGYGFVKVRLDAQSKAIDAGMLKRMEAQVTKNIEAAGRGDTSHWNAGARLDTYYKKSGKYMYEKSDSSWLNTYVHEMGHQVHYMAGAPRFKGKYNPSQYGKSNKEEWFAETFLQYTMAPEALKKAAPDAYKFVDKVVKQVMDPTAKPGHVNRWKQNKTVDPDKYFNEANSTQRKQTALEALEVAPKVKAPPNYSAMTVAQLKAAAKAAGVKGYSKMIKADLYTAVSGQKVGFESVKAAAVAKKAAAKAKKDLADAKAGKLPKPVPPAAKTPAAKTPAAKTPGAKTVKQLQAEAKAAGLKGYSKLKKPELEALLASSAKGSPAPAPPAPKPQAPKPQAVKTTPKKVEPLPKLPADGFKADGTLALTGQSYNPGPTLAGSTKPRLYATADGNQVVVKGGGAKGQNVAEHAAQRVYRTIDSGNSLNSRLIDGKLVNDFLSTGQTTGQMSAADLKKHGVTKHLRKQTAADALLANWDVKGLAGDNVMVTSDGRVVKIDAGGTFDFRAQGAKKKYGSIPEELFSLRAKNGQLQKDWATANNADYQRLYQDGIGGIVAKSKQLLNDVKGLPKDVQKAFADRLQVYKAISDFANGTRKLSNGKTLNQAIEEGLIDWQTFDYKVGQAIQSLAKNPSLMKGGNIYDVSSVTLATSLDIGPPPKVAPPKVASPPPAKTASTKKTTGKGSNAPEPDLFDQMFGTNRKWVDYKQPKTAKDYMDFDTNNLKFMSKDQLQAFKSGAMKMQLRKDTPIFEGNQIYDKALDAETFLLFIKNGGKPQIAPVKTPKLKTQEQKDFDLVHKYLGLEPVHWNKKTDQGKAIAVKAAMNKQAKARANTDPEMPGFKAPKTPVDYLKFADADLTKLSMKQLETMKSFGNNTMLSGGQTKQVMQAVAAKTKAVQQELANKQSAMFNKTGVAVTPKKVSAQQLEGTQILNPQLSQKVKQDFVDKWGNGSQKGIFPNLKAGTNFHDSVLKSAAANEKAFYQGKGLLEGHLKTLTTAQLQIVAKKVGIKFPEGTPTTSELLKSIYIAEYTGQNYQLLADVAQLPSEYINSLAPGSIKKKPKAGQSETDLNSSPTGGVTPEGMLPPTKGKFNPLKDSIAKQEKIRGTSTHITPIWKTEVGSYVDNQRSPKVIDAVGEALKKAGHAGDSRTVEMTLRALESYTGGGYKAQKAALMEIHRPDLYKGLPKAHKDRVNSTSRGDAELVQKAIEALPLFRGQEVMRGMSFNSGRARAEFLRKYANGEGIGSMDSYSTARNTAEGFDSGPNAIVMHVETPQGAVSVKGMSQVAGENEVLFTRHTRFRVKKMAWDSRGYREADPSDVGGGDKKQLHVWLEEI